MSAKSSLTRQQCRRVDQLAIERLQIPGIVLMENAGIHASDIATGMLESVGGSKVAIVCGGGNNGGDGFVIARHLVIAGRTVVVYLATDPALLTGDAATNYHIYLNMGVRLVRVDDAASLEVHSPKWIHADVIVDALLGTGFNASRGLRPHMAAVIAAINQASQVRRVSGGAGPRVLAVDVPSGLDCDTGQPAEPSVIADATVTFVAPKVGFEVQQAKAYLGAVFVVGIGVPEALVDEVRNDQ